MKLKFIRIDNDNIDVKIRKNAHGEEDFTYVAMIKRLYNKEQLEVPEFQGEFTEEEQKSLISLAQQISEKINQN